MVFMGHAVPLQDLCQLCGLSLLPIMAFLLLCLARIFLLFTLLLVNYPVEQSLSFPSTTKQYFLYLEVTNTSLTLFISLLLIRMTHQLFLCISWSFPLNGSCLIWILLSVKIFRPGSEMVPIERDHESSALTSDVNQLQTFEHNTQSFLAPISDLKAERMKQNSRLTSSFGSLFSTSSYFSLPLFHSCLHLSFSQLQLCFSLPCFLVQKIFPPGSPEYVQIVKCKLSIIVVHTPHRFVMRIHLLNICKAFEHCLVHSKCN